jgi:hypothetical protein
MTLAGFPHSGTPGSTPTCGSPRLFAACRALLRLSVPRHPPCALVRLTGFPRTPIERRGFHPAHRSFLWTTTLVLASLLDALLDQLPNTRVFNAIRLGECLPSALDLRALAFGVPRDAYSRLQKGGDPAAGSPTATLLRLRPSHRARLRRLPPASGLGHRLRALPTPMA